MILLLKHKQLKPFHIPKVMAACQNRQKKYNPIHIDGIIKLTIENTWLLMLRQLKTTQSVFREQFKSAKICIFINAVFQGQ